MSTRDLKRPWKPTVWIVWNRAIVLGSWLLQGIRIRVKDKQSNRQITEENSSGTILKHVKSVESVLCDKHKFSSYVSN